MIDDDDFDVAEKPVLPVERAAPIATRAPAPRPRRLSRRAITLFAGGSSIGLAAALVFALSSGGHHATPQETVAVDHRQPSDLLATAPKDYGAVAREKATALGPPSGSSNPPGASGADGSPSPATGTATSSSSNNEATAAVQRQRQQRDSARSSKLFAGAEAGGSTQTAEAQSATSVATPTAPNATTSPVSADAQDRKAAFSSRAALAPLASTEDSSPPPPAATS